MRRFNNSSTFWMSLILLGATAISSLAQPRYTVTDLGILPDKNSTSVWGNHSLNNAGHVAGHCNLGDLQLGLFGDFYSGNVAFLWTPQDGIQGLPLLPGKAYASAFTLNDRGQVLGLAGNSWADAHAVLWEKGTVRDLGTLPGATTSYLQGINNRGQIVGSSGVYDLVSEFPVLWEKGQMIALPMGSYVAGQAFNINDNGQISGQLRTYLNNWVDGAVPVFWDRNGLTFLQTLDGSWGSAWAINNRGQIAGYSGPADGSAHAVMWENGILTDCGTLGGTWGVLWDINDTGQAVGDSTTANDEADHAILVENGIMYDLNDYISADSGWILVFADGINNRGQISGTGILNGEVRGFLLTPKKR